MAAASSDDVEDWMDGPLVIWLKSCLENPNCLRDYEDLLDGVIVYQVLLQIDPEPTHTGVVSSHGNPQIRIRNLDIIVKNLKVLYQEELGQLVVITPDVFKLVKEVNNPAAKQEMSLLLLLLLACAVQCPNKEIFIEKIKSLDIEVQHSIVECIKQVTDTQTMVINIETLDTNNYEILLNHIKHLLNSRDEYHQQFINNMLSTDINNANNNNNEIKRRASSNVSTNNTSESHHLAVELADWKSKLRRQRQELEEKTEALVECKDELEQQRLLVTKLRQDISDVVQEARSAKAYRDELDVMREKAEKADKLETEVQRYKDKLSDIEFYKTRIQELREDNRVLLETREMVEDQLQRARRRGDHVLELEAEILRLKQQINDLSLERDNKDKKLDELYQEHAELQVLARSALHDQSTELNNVDSEEQLSTGSASLSEQLTQNATARALRLELENRKLLSTIESLKESAFLESGNKILELEKENKKLGLNIEQLEETCRRLTSQNKELESIIEESLQENRKLQESKELLRATADKQQQELQNDRVNLEQLKCELEVQNKETDRLKQQIKQLETGLEDIEVWRCKAEQVPLLTNTVENLKHKLAQSEKDVDSFNKEVARLRQIIEEKDVKLDKYNDQVQSHTRQLATLGKELNEANNMITKLHEIELEKDELSTKSAMIQETLAALQNELVTEKVNYRQLESNLERFGLSVEILSDPETTVEQLLQLGTVKQLLTAEPCSKCSVPSVADDNTKEQDKKLLTNESESLQAENVHLQVMIATLQSQITSLSSHHTALQLANSQLVAEKEELVKERMDEKTSHNELLKDQVALQTLHEQLSSEHECVLREREQIRQTNKELTKQIKLIQDNVVKLENNNKTMKKEIEELKIDSVSLLNLRAEHSKLKEDFRNLFTASEKVKSEYRAIQEEYKTLRADASSLRLRHTELQGETASLSDHATHLQIQMSKIASQNEMLLQLNSNLEEDRRSLMEHVSRLLTQYHELLTHSLEDKQHYHLEEKMFADKVNHLSRQKEKLEEKIMDHYRKLESCSTKKKGFGASLVRRVRKAGTELINKSRRSWHEDTRQSSLTHLGSESGGNESDASADDIRQDNVSSHPLGFPTILNQQEAGTRRAVYYTGMNLDSNREDVVNEEPEDELNKSSPTLLVYNRINTVVGGPPSPNHSVRSHKSNVSAPKMSPSEEARRKAKKENPIWYEYGCV